MTSIEPQNPGAEESLVTVQLFLSCSTDEEPEDLTRERSDAVPQTLLDAMM